jgi:protein TonB
VFENVGRDPDKEGGKRRAVSLVLTILLIGGGVGVSAGLAYYTATEVLPDIIEDLELVELVEIAEEAMEEEAPPPPPPPPPPGPEEEIDEDSEEAPQPDEMVEDVKDLEDKVEDRVAADKGRPPGDTDGQIGGEIGGVAGGVVGGTGARVMHHSEVEVKKRVDPSYPKAARDANLGDQRCLVKVSIGEDGVPYDVKVENCPKVFHAATIESIMKWRWYPPKVGKQKVKAQITIGVNYKVR